MKAAPLLLALPLAAVIPVAAVERWGVSPYHQFGTTCYAWTHQTPGLQEQTLQTLAASPFNKIRFCVLPKSYAHNKNEPGAPAAQLYDLEADRSQSRNLVRDHPEQAELMAEHLTELQKKSRSTPPFSKP